MADSQPLRDIVSTQMKAAMKAARRSGSARCASSWRRLKEREIEARGAGKIVSRSDELALLTKMVKSRQELAAIYAEAGRAELAAQENAEVAVISEFLPKQMGEERSDRRRQGRHRRDWSCERQGHGQSGQRAEGGARRPDGLRQGERDRESAAEWRLRPIAVWSNREQGGQARPAGVAAIAAIRLCA